MTIESALALICFGVAAVTCIGIIQYQRLRLVPDLRNDHRHEPGEGRSRKARAAVSAVVTPVPGVDPRRTLQRLVEQPDIAQIIVVGDAVGSVVGRTHDRVLSLPPAPTPTGWTSRRWAQQQGLRHVQTSWVLLLDGDLELVPGTVSTALEFATTGNLDWLSLQPVEADPGGFRGLLAVACLLLRSVGDLFSRRREFTSSALLVRHDALATVGGLERCAARDDRSWLIRQALDAQGCNGATRTGQAIRAHRAIGWRHQQARLLTGDALAGVLWLIAAVCAGVVLWPVVEFAGGIQPSSALPSLSSALLAAAAGLLVGAHIWGLKHYNRAASWWPVSLALAVAVAATALTAPFIRVQPVRDELDEATAWDTGVEG